MAKLNKENEIEFDENDVQSAWDNSPVLINKPEEEFRMCYICKFHMIKAEFNNYEIGKFGWFIDLINLKTPDLNVSNFVAIHPGCQEFKKKIDNTKILKKIKNTNWYFDVDLYEKN